MARDGVCADCGLMMTDNYCPECGMWLCEYCYCGDEHEHDDDEDLSDWPDDMGHSIEEGGGAGG